MTTTTDFIYDAITSNTDDCILWPFKNTSKGYPRYERVVDGERIRVRANRFVCAKVHGKPPKWNSQAAHSCGVRACVNPRHLRWTSARDNADDLQTIRKRRQDNGGYLPVPNPAVI